MGPMPSDYTSALWDHITKGALGIPMGWLGVIGS